ncbi:hypothetical protein ACIGCK_04640 [Microbacterium sp. NPDC078428]|uniref:hypothetical protein n=1 Tax=Microbacterium sp. NPDC078428 TaxID=3364190 RepID=UPI0037CC09E3
MRLRTTSTQRTYRYVRLSLVGAVVLLGVAFAAVSVAQGPPASLSAAFYTPARDVFVGAVFAVSLALLALSGRSVEQALLDYAAILAPLIAIVPTPLAVGDVPGFASSCLDTAPCVPAAFLPGIAVGVAALVVVGSAGVVTAVVLALVQGTCSRGFVLAASGAGVLVVAVALWALLDAEGFVRGAHLAAAVAFFGLIAAVAALAAFAPAGARARGGVRALYSVVAVGIAITVLALLAAIVATLAGADLGATGVPVVLVGEVVVLVFFAVFWVAQTVELWDDPDLGVDARE